MKTKISKRTIDIFYRNQLLVRTFSILLAISGAGLLSLNVVGLFEELRRPGLGVDDHEQLRFIPDDVLELSESLEKINALGNLESPDEIAYAANQTVHRSLVHVNWPDVSPEDYRQLIPIWENYFLFSVGKFSGLPQFERYHFSDYKRSLERGIGICGDFSIVLSQVLSLYDIQSDIISFDGHVVVEYISESGDPIILDPDFGVSIPLSYSELGDNEEFVKSIYLSAGYSPSEVGYLFDIYGKSVSVFDDTYAFMSKRYIFERVSYALKWFFPIIMSVIGVLGLFFVHRYNSRGSGGPKS